MNHVTMASREMGRVAEAGPEEDARSTARDAASSVDVSGPAVKSPPYRRSGGLYHGRMSSRLVIWLLAFAALLVACGGGGSSSTPTPAGSPTPVVRTLTRVTLGYPTGNLIVELATTPAQSELGLGYRDSLFVRGGMLFDLGATRIPSFWMKGMRFPLDMVWIGEDKKIAEITANVPDQPGAPDEQLKRYSPASPVRYVLEINAGAAAQFSLAPGQQLAFTIPETIADTPTAAAATDVAGLPPTRAPTPAR
jgi:uncharacterized membrane protein (UPF0127 family)